MEYSSNVLNSIYLFWGSYIISRLFVTDTKYSQYKVFDSYIYNPFTSYFCRPLFRTLSIPVSFQNLFSFFYQTFSLPFSHKLSLFFRPLLCPSSLQSRSGPRSTPVAVYQGPPSERKGVLEYASDQKKNLKGDFIWIWKTGRWTLRPLYGRTEHPSGDGSLYERLGR